MALIKCKECKIEVSSTAKSCPHCGTDLRNWFARHKFFTFILFLLLFVSLFTDFWKGFKDGFQKEYDKNISEETAEKEYVTSPALAQDQHDFHNMRKSYNSNYEKQKNDIQKSDVFTDAESATLEFAKKHDWKFKDWEGIIKSIVTDKGGEKLYLTIISDLNGQKIKYTTSSCIIGCGIEKGKAVYNQVRNLQEGQKVLFSGNFTNNGEGNVNELSITESGSMYYPEFRIEFTEIKLFSSKNQSEYKKIEKHLTIKANLEQDMKKFTDNFRGFLKTSESDTPTEIKGDVELSESFEALFNVFINSSGQITYISEYTTTPSGDWTILYSSYFDSNGRILLLEKERRFFNQNCSESFITDKETIYYNNNFEKITDIRLVTDTNGNNLDISKCGFYYEFDYKPSATASMFLKEKGIKID